MFRRYGLSLVSWLSVCELADAEGQGCVKLDKCWAKHTGYVVLKKYKMNIHVSEN
jgi:hypothetical protein